MIGAIDLSGMSISRAEFFTWVIVLIAIWIFVRVVQQVSGNSKWLKSGLDPKVNRILEAFEKGYSSILVIGLLALFIAVRPVLHGIFVLLLILFCLPLIRNYFVGVMVRYQTQIRAKMDIRFEDQIYKVQRLSIWGVHLSSSIGDRYVNYHLLSEKGFDCMSEKTAAVSSQFIIIANGHIDNPKELLKRVVYNSPYLDFTKRPVIEPILGDSSSFRLELGMQGRNDLQSFKDHLQSLGFEIKET